MTAYYALGETLVHSKRGGRDSHQDRRRLFWFLEKLQKNVYFVIFPILYEIY